MNPVIAIIAPGAMGAAIGSRLVNQGLRVLTSLKNRSIETVKRANAAGMTDATDEEIVSADFILSILPPGHAIQLAERFQPILAECGHTPLYLDCNAVSPTTIERIANILASTGCLFADVGIIGGPPKIDSTGPRFYVSGSHAQRFAAFRQFELDIRVLDGPLSSASALKMSYSGITKGLQALGAAMILAASRNGIANELFAELVSSQPQLLALLKRQLSGMPPKSYRWVAEMLEIAEFVGNDSSGHEMYVGAAHFYEQVARDFESERKDLTSLQAFLENDVT